MLRIFSQANLTSSPMQRTLTKGLFIDLAATIGFLIFVGGIVMLLSNGPSWGVVTYK